MEEIATASCQQHQLLRRFAITYLGVIAVFGTLLFASKNDTSGSNNYEFKHSGEPKTSHGRRLGVVADRLSKLNDPKYQAPDSLSQFNDPKSVALRSDADNAELAENRHNCQVVYIMGVEGATHHGFLPVLEKLASIQVDPTTGLKYEVNVNPVSLKAGLFGWFRNRHRQWGFHAGTPPVDDPDLVRSVVRSSCPVDGRRHVLLEWQSFPSGHEDDPRSYRVHRRHEWLGMTPLEIATSDAALQHPANMTAFAEAYAPFAQVRFVVLSRPFLETIASHPSWDEGPEVHSNIIRGFTLVLAGFLERHYYDVVDGARLWTMVCVERVMAKRYRNRRAVRNSRADIVSYLTEFLGWPVRECPQCFDSWHDSTKDPFDVLGRMGPNVVNELLEHKKLLEGVWPPLGEEGVLEQQCDL